MSREVDSYGVPTEGLCQHCGERLPEAVECQTGQGLVIIIGPHRCPHIADPDTPAPCYAERESRQN